MGIILNGMEVFDDDTSRKHLLDYADWFIFRYYDAVADSNPMTLSSVDIAITSVINSKVRWRQIHAVMQHRPQIDTALNDIPFSLSLLNDFGDTVKSKVTHLFSMCKVPFVRLSTVSKILHRKRRNLIPLMDREFMFHYCEVARAKGEKIPKEEPERAVFVMERFREDLAANDLNIEKLKGSNVYFSRRVNGINSLRLLEALICQAHKRKSGNIPVYCTGCSQD